MATQFPNDPNADRFIDGLSMTDDGGAIADLPEENQDVEELEDGSAIVTLGEFEGPEENPDFYENLAETINLFDLEKIGMRYLDQIGRAHV